MCELSEHRLEDSIVLMAEEGRALGHGDKSHTAFRFRYINNSNETQCSDVFKYLKEK